MEAHAEAHEEAMRIWQDEVLTHGTPALVVEMRFQSNILLCAYVPLVHARNSPGIPRIELTRRQPGTRATASGR